MPRASGFWVSDGYGCFVPTSIDLAVVGGGVVGLALADAWLSRFPGESVVVYDKEDQLARHASGRNSGVLHAGFYYAPDSLKARLTRDGNRMLREFCAQAGVEVLETGKVVVTTAEEQLPALMMLVERGRANGVDLELVDEVGLNELEPLARTVQSALWSPTTAVADPVEVVRALAAQVERKGGRVEQGNQVITGEAGQIVTARDGRISVGHVINAAGLYADRVAHWFGFGEDYRMLPFKGLYWYGNWQAGKIGRAHV